MVTMAQRIEELRMARNMSRPALAAALGLPRTAVEKFETGRQTPTQAQQEQLAAFFGVSLLDGAFLDAPAGDSRSAPRRAPKEEPAVPSGQGSILDALIGGKKFQESLRAAVLEVLRSPEGQDLLAKAIRRELTGRK